MAIIQDGVYYTSSGWLQVKKTIKNQVMLAAYVNISVEERHLSKVSLTLHVYNQENTVNLTKMHIMLQSFSY